MSRVDDPAVAASAPAGTLTSDDRARYRVGAQIVSPGRTVTECDLHDFAALSGDWTALHMDSVAAAAGPFGTRVAHGFLTLSLASGLLLRLGSQALMPSTTIGLYGLDHVRFRAPVRIGDTVHVVAELRAVRPRPERQHVLEWHCAVKRQDKLVAAVFDLLILCHDEPAAA